MEDDLGHRIRDELAMAKPPPDVVAMPRTKTSAAQPIPVGHQHVTGYELDPDGITYVEGSCVVGSILTKETLQARARQRPSSSRTALSTRCGSIQPSAPSSSSSCTPPTQNMTTPAPDPGAEPVADVDPDVADDATDPAPGAEPLGLGPVHRRDLFLTPGMLERALDPIDGRTAHLTAMIHACRP